MRRVRYVSVGIKNAHLAVVVAVGMVTAASILLILYSLLVAAPLIILYVQLDARVERDLLARTAPTAWTP